MNATDRILCKGLAYECQIGFHEQEFSNPQKITLDIDVEVPQPNKREDVDAISFDYYKANKVIQEFLNAKSYLLIETLAHDLADLIMEAFPVQSLKLSLNKFPEGMPNMESVSYICERSRP